MARQRWQEWAENEENLSVLAAWARAGQTDEDIAKAIGISRSTLSEWKKKHEPIRKALSTGKDFANRLVENSLFKMSLGFHVTVKKVFKVKTVEFGPDGKRKGEKEELQTAEETEYIKPDPGDHVLSKKQDAERVSRKASAIRGWGGWRKRRHGHYE